MNHLGLAVNITSDLHKLFYVSTFDAGLLWQGLMSPFPLEEPQRNLNVLLN